ncbi:helix-turn-helix transcriptional regulator [Paeniglutamicibacter antarcticus]
MASPLVIARAPRGAGKRVAVHGWLSRNEPRDHSWSWIDCDDSVESLEAELQRHFVDATDPDSHLVVLSGFGVRHEGPFKRILEKMVREHPGRRLLMMTREYLELERRRTLLPFGVTVLPPYEFSFNAEEAAAYFRGTALEQFAMHLAKDLGGTPQLMRIAKLRAETMERPVPARASEKTDEPASPLLSPSVGLGQIDPQSKSYLSGVRRAVARDVKMMLDAEALAPGQLDFLARLAVPTEVPSELLPLIAPNRSGNWLPDLERRGLVFRSSRNVDAEYALHPVLRQVLLESYMASDAQRLKSLQRICARFEMDQGSAFRALRHALAIPDHQLASDVLRMHLDEYITGEFGIRSAPLLDELPMAVLARFPLLAICLAIAYSATGKFKLKTLELLALAAAGARTVGRKMPPVDRLFMVVIESVASRLSGIGELSLRTARGGVAMYREMSPEERDRLGSFEGPMLVQLALSLHAAGAVNEALTASEMGVSADHRHNRTESDRYAATVQAYLHAMGGDIHRASAVLAESLPEHWSNPETNAYFASPFRIASFICAVEGQRFDDAARWAQLLRIDEHNNEFWPVIRWADALLAVISGETATSLVRMQGYLVREREQPVVQKNGKQMLISASCLLNLAVGDSASALKIAAKSGQETSRALLQARVRLARGEAAEALRLCTVLGSTVQPRTRFQQAVLVLGATLQLGNAPAAAQALLTVAALGREYGLGLSLNLLPGPDLERVLAAAKELGINLNIDQRITSNIPGGLGGPMLSSRELAVLGELLSTGRTAEIAERQFVSINTVKSQLRSIYRKLEVSDRASALEAARVQGLFTIKEFEAIE